MKQVEPGTRSGDTAADTGREHDNAPQTEAARDINALRREMERRDLPAGPPPSFEVSQLEIETDIQQVIARVEAARTQAREADALKLEAMTEERLAEAEMARLAEAEMARLAEAATTAPAVGGTSRLAGTEAGTGPNPGASATPAASGSATASLDAHL